jgi:hypothetical protein
MTYRVLWRPPASNALLVNFMRAADKPAMFAASREIERVLGTDPHGAGESRSDGIRMTFVRPLVVLYSIDEPNMIVYVERLQWVGL